MMHIDSRNQHSGSWTSRGRQWRAQRKLPPNPPKVKHRRLAALNPDASLSFDERDNDAYAPRDKNVLDDCVDSVAALLFDGCAAIAGRSRHDSSAARGRSGYIDKRDNDIPHTRKIGRLAPTRLSKLRERFTPFPMNGTLALHLEQGIQRSSALTAKSESELRWLSMNDELFILFVRCCHRPSASSHQIGCKLHPVKNSQQENLQLAHASNFKKENRPLNPRLPPDLCGF